MNVKETILQTSEIRELTGAELDEVSGGFLFALGVLAFAIGFDAGFIAMSAWGPMKGVG